MRLTSQAVLQQSDKNCNCECLESTGDTTIKKEVVLLRKDNKRAQEENNLLKYKLELLLDMVSLLLLCGKNINDSFYRNFYKT